MVSEVMPKSGLTGEATRRVTNRGFISKPHRIHVSLPNIIAFRAFIVDHHHELTRSTSGRYPPNCDRPAHSQVCVHRTAFIDHAAPRTPEQLTLSLQRTYHEPGLIFHQLNAWLVGALRNPTSGTWPWLRLSVDGHGAVHCSWPTGHYYSGHRCGWWHHDVCVGKRVATACYSDE